MAYNSDELNTLQGASRQGLIGKKLRGKTIVFTGKISITRREIDQLAWAYNFRVGSAVTPHTHYIVVGEIPGGATTSKLSAAISYGVRRLTEQEFSEMLR